MANPAEDSVHPLVRQAAAWAWRLLILLTAVVALLWVMKIFEVIFVSTAVALLLSALLLPGVDWLDRHGVHRGLAVFLLLATGLAAISGILAFVISQFIEGVPGLVVQVTQVVDSSRAWLVNGPLHLSAEQMDKLRDTVTQALQTNQSALTSGALSTAGTITEIVTGAFVVLFTMIFFLYGGRNIWQFVVKIFPTAVREKVHTAGIAGFRSLIGYTRATFLVALVDAVGIGTGLAILGVPLALPLASLVFLGAFIPLVGAVVTGFLAVIVALIAKGWIVGLIAFGVVIGVNQLESHVLQPLVMGRAVAIHPLAVVLGISAGALLAGIVGALLAVPMIAFFDRAIRVLIAPDEEAEAVADGDDLIEEPVAITAQPDQV
ncbi:AI-2E family transporter [Mycobacterium sp. 1274756.6]|uniref:AI-2E family transporter n=1 Tax=Mycobacterium sp. 1274756.6 TaxID=1834076 RepID=UPI0007FBF126|nr:AI-2E family transporter [Mycobacterium sp. 1274756.6]OBJ71257.1 AI-2E family transporter [Mycobacterium sp. 1274756.6]